MSAGHDLDRDDEFLATSCRAMRASPGPEALDALGWWELLPALADRDGRDAGDARDAVFAVFRAQGRELADSAALGGLLAQPFLDRTRTAPGPVLAAIRRRSARRGPVWVVVGRIDGRSLLFDEPGCGVFVVDAADVELQRVDVPGRSVVHEISVDLAAHRPSLGPDVADLVRPRSAYLGRVAVASEILGACERAVELATEHATIRVQFGQPIGTFQAVRHLLARATTDCVALDSVVREALRLLDDPPARYGEVVKALAGRNGRRACERSLQVLGGIGFTAEHPHHHHHSRVLLLDALLGTSAELRLELGSWLRTTRSDPGFASAMMLAGA